MRHLRKGRKLGRSSSHRRALFRNLASALILTEQDAEHLENAPKTKGRIVTTLQKAKEIRPLVEKCVTIARDALPHMEEAEQYATTADRYHDADEYRQWRQSDRWQKWNQAMAPAITARRRCLTLLGNKEAVKILFEEIAPRFADRNGGYTRILRLADRRLGDAGEKAILEFVGRNDRVAVRSERPAFDQDEEQAADQAQASDQAQAVEQTPAPQAEPSAGEGQPPAGGEERSET